MKYNVELVELVISFTFEKSKVKPDIVPIAKGIGGGFPIGAVLMTKKLQKQWVQEHMVLRLGETHWP